MTNAGDPLTMACGHAIPCPPRLGRGQARAKRLAAIAAHKCPPCRRADVWSAVCRLTDGHGWMLNDWERLVTATKWAQRTNLTDSRPDEVIA